MKKILASFLFAGAIAGCGPKHASFVKVDNVALGRVVVYRNGVAFYERKAQVTGGKLTVSVPRDRVDDFLKSLTVVDVNTRQSLPVSIPRDRADSGDYLVMQLQLPSNAPTNVLLTYVTEAPAWKPSYRVVVGPQGKVMLEGSAVVDNTSGEDWKGVLVGVGSSSALSFQYDMWSVRHVQRETLASGETLALAPPTGGSPFATTPAAEGQQVLAQLEDDEIRRPEGHPESVNSVRNAMPIAPGAAPVASTASRVDSVRKEARAKRARAAGAVASMDEGGGGGDDVWDYEEPAPPPAKPVQDRRAAQGDSKIANLPRNILAGNQTIEIQAIANANTAGAAQRANDRANIIRNQLIDKGVAPGRIKIVAEVAANQRDNVKIIAKAPTPAELAAAKTAAPGADAPPVGESHFASEIPMTVNRGSSVMVSMVRTETEGEVVYMYDSESARGNDRFAFKAVRLRNPTDSTLETGPVTVFGENRFIGEGLTDPIPPKASVVVPFALDRQVVIDRHSDNQTKISKLVTLQRGILTAEVQHVKRTKLTLTSRLPTPSKVFVRHTVGKGWTLLDGPKSFERLGDAHLFEIQLGANQQKTIELVEATPMERTMDLAADVTLEMLGLYVQTPEMDKQLREQLGTLLAIHREIADTHNRQTSLRKKLADYRERMDELHAQLVTLKAVKTGGDLLAHLRTKMKDISERVQKTTIELVDAEEQIMLSRIRFADTLAELSLPGPQVAKK